MNKLKQIEFHKREINRHRNALKDLGHLKKRYQLSCSIPFIMFSNWLHGCRCGHSTHTLIAYKSQVMCSRCAYRKFGYMQTVKEWEVV